MRGLVPSSGNGVKHKCDPDFRASWKGGGTGEQVLELG